MDLNRPRPFASIVIRRIYRYIARCRPRAAKPPSL